MSEERRVQPYVGWGYREGRISRVLDELRTHNEVKVGDAYVVRIPKIPGKILIDDGTRNTEYVIYVYESWYDKEKKQMRNRKVCIGQKLYAFPGAMLPNENYYRYFDRVTGEEKKRTEENEGAGDHTKGSSPGADSRKQRAAIQKVLEDQRIIKRGPERLREAIREQAEDIQNMREDREMIGQEQEEKEIEEKGTFMEDAGIPDIQVSEDEKRQRRRLRVLLDVLTSIRDVVKKQAQRRPDEVMNEYQVEKINPVLEEIIRIEKEMGLGDLLETIRKTEKGADGKVEVQGMSYGDIEVLLEYFNSVVWFTQSEML